MQKTDQVIITNRLETREGYLVHALCEGGKCRFLFNGKPYKLRRGDLTIVRKGMLMENVEPSANFNVRNLLISKEFVEYATPQSNYGMRGQLALFLNPVMHLADWMFDRCRLDFTQIGQRIEEIDSHFYLESIRTAVQVTILDFFDFHSRMCHETPVSERAADVMARFIGLLEDGNYIKRREVAWYADQLCVTSKYLSESSKSVSGYPAAYWITRYTILDISRRLRNRSFTFAQIAEQLGFSSPAYFSRYVMQHLGVSPTDYRD